MLFAFSFCIPVLTDRTVPPGLRTLIGFRNQKRGASNVIFFKHLMFRFCSHVLENFFGPGYNILILSITSAAVAGKPRF
jgi:hypothetical protein